jgi:capsular exopolysaccharide synthesis family protein
MKPFFKYAKYWYLFLICIAICMAVAVGVIYFTTPYYQVNTTLLLQDDKKGDGILKESAFSDLNMFHTTKTIENEIQVLRSVNLMKKVLNRLSINSQVFVGTGLLKKEVYGKTSPVVIKVMRVSPQAMGKPVILKMLDQNRFALTLPDEVVNKNYHFGDTISNAGFSMSIAKGPAFVKGDREVHLSLINVDELAKSYRDRKLEITEIVKDANVLQIGVLDNIPARGIDILTQLVKEYNLEDIAFKNQMALATIDFIDTRLSYLTQDLGTVERNVQQYKQLNRVTNVAADAQSNLQRAEDYKQQLEAINVQLGILNAVDVYLRKAGRLLPIVPGTAGLQDGSLLTLINKYNATQEEYQQLLTENLPGNPLVINIKQKLSVIRENISGNIASIRTNLMINRQSLVSNSSKFEARIQTAPEIEHGLQQRDREQSVKVNLFQYLIQKREETALTLSANVPDAKVIDQANYDSSPTKPKRQLIFLSALLFGFIIPVSFIWTKDKLNSRVDNVEEITDQTNVRILGEVCHARGSGGLAINGKHRNNITELFRYIRSNLGSNVPHGNSQVLMVTSSVQGEGKTFTCINLAATLANIDKKVVLLEFDLRKPDLINKMKLEKGIGISDYLHSENMTAREIIIPSGISDNLSVIGSGLSKVDAGNEMLNPRIVTLFEELREEFDYVIIDTSPIALVADAFSLDMHSDATIYVVRYNYTQKSHLNILADIEKNNKLKNLMVILNDGKTEHIKHYGYGSRDYA